jgi:hypothetical protein
VINKVLLLSVLIGIFGCASSGNSRNASANLAEYKNMLWKDRITFLEKNGRKFTRQDTPIYRHAFKDGYYLVTIAAIESMNAKMNNEMRKDLYILLRHWHPIVRWKTCKKIIALPKEDDLKPLSILFGDKEWLARECVFSGVRLYEKERIQKLYFLRLLSRLNDNNIQALTELYKTLKWYEDPRTFMYLYKRSFHTHSSIELIKVLKELAFYKDSKVKNRLWSISHTHKDFFVREEVSKIYLTY